LFPKLYNIAYDFGKVGEVMYKRGDIVFYNHRNAYQNSNVKSGSHEYIVLHTFTHPLRTYLLAPVTSTPANGNVAFTCVKLEQKKYPDVLEHDSYIDLRFIVAADESRIHYCKKNDHPSGLRKNGSEIIPCINLNPKDTVDLDLHLILTLELNDTINLLVDKQAEEKLEAYKTDLKGKYKYVIEKLQKILERTKDGDLIKEIAELISYVADMKKDS